MADTPSSTASGLSAGDWTASVGKIATPNFISCSPPRTLPEPGPALP